MIKTFTLLDLIIIALTIIGAIFSFTLFDTHGDSGVVVYRQNTVIAKFPININNQYTVAGLLDSIVLNVYADGKVEIAHVNCPRQLCIRGGAVRAPRGQIVCAPNNILIQIRAPRNRDEHGKVDAIAY